MEGHDLAFTARSVQLGTSGMSLEHAGQLAMAYPVLLTFALPSGFPVRVGAVVWWKTKELVGLRFDPRDDNRQIQEWVQRAAVAKSAAARSEEAATAGAVDASQIGDSSYA